MPPTLRLGLALAAALCAQPGGALASNIGVATAVAPAARAIPPAAAPRILHVGVDLQADERVTTDVAGRAHLIFLDGSALTIGPNSDVTLDEYVYDADRGVGRTAISIARGVLRFVGGGISKRTPVEIRTPTATMGIRGGVAIVEVGERVAATFLFGTEMTLTSGGVTQRVVRPGFQIVTDGAGVPQPPVPVDSGRLAATLAMLETTQPSTAPGAPTVTDDDVAATQVGLLNSTGGLGEIEPAAGPAPPPPLPQAFRVDDMAQLAARFAAAPSGANPPANPPGAAPPSDEEPGEAPPPSDDPGPPPAEPVFTGGFAGQAIQSGGASVTFFGGLFREGAFLADVTAGRALILTTRGREVVSVSQPFGSEVLSGTFRAVSPQFLLFNLQDEDGTRVFSFAGQPTAADALPTTGISAYPLFGDFVADRAMPFVADVGHAGGLGGPAAVSRPGRAYIAWDDSAPGARRAFGGGAVAIFGAGPGQEAAAAMLFGEVTDDGEGRPHVRARLFGQRSAGGTPEFYAGAIASSDSGDDFDLFGPGANFVLETVEADATDRETASGIVRSGVGGVGAVTLHAQHATGFPAAASAGQRTSRSLQGFAGGVERLFEVQPGGPMQITAAILSTRGDPTVSLETRADLNTLGATFVLTDGAEEVKIGFGADAEAASAFIDDRTFFADGAEVGRRTSSDVPFDESAGRYGLITASELQHDGLLPAGVSFCLCEHLAWGFFGGERSVPSGLPEAPRWRSLELAAWVAGELSDPSRLIDIGTRSATYQGHLIGSVARGGAVFRAIGGLSLAFDFSPGFYDLREARIANFDGIAFQAGTGGPFYGNGFAVTLEGDHPQTGAVVADLEGAFFGPGGPPANAAGDFRIRHDPDRVGGQYQAGGIFAVARPAGP